MNLLDLRARIESVEMDPGGLIQSRLDQLTKPPGSLGRLEELALLFCSIRNVSRPIIKHKVIFTMAGDHGVVAEGVSAFPQEVTRQMVANFAAGGAAINVLARHVGARVVVIDCGVASDVEEMKGITSVRVRKLGRGTANIALGPAMSREQAERAIDVGIAAFEEEWPAGIDIIGTGDMGIGNTTPSAAIAALLTGRAVVEVTGTGTGIDSKALARKIEVIERALRVNRPVASDPMDILAKVGGFEIGALAGLCIAAARRRTPVVLDGLISTAGAALAVAFEPKVKDYLIASHASVEPGHRALLQWLGKDPLLDLKMRLGEGTGAALGIFLVEAGVRILNEMATFSSAGVSRSASTGIPEAEKSQGGPRTQIFGQLDSERETAK